MSRRTQHEQAVIRNLELGQIRKTKSTDYSKRQLRDLEYFQKGVTMGAELQKAKIHNSVAGLDYGVGYYVAPTVLLLEGPTA